MAEALVDSLLVNEFGDKGVFLEIIDSSDEALGSWTRDVLIRKIESAFGLVAEDAREDLRKRYRMVPHDFMEGNRG